MLNKLIEILYQKWPKKLVVWVARWLQSKKGRDLVHLCVLCVQNMTGLKYVLFSEYVEDECMKTELLSLWQFMTLSCVTAHLDHTPIILVSFPFLRYCNLLSIFYMSVFLFPILFLRYFENCCFSLSLSCLKRPSRPP